MIRNGCNGVIGGDVHHTCVAIPGYNPGELECQLGNLLISLCSMRPIRIGLGKITHRKVAFNLFPTHPCMLPTIDYIINNSNEISDSVYPNG